MYEPPTTTKEHDMTPYKTAKLTVRENTYMGARAEVTTEHFDSNPIGVRRITMLWLEDAHEVNGGHKAGTRVTKVIKGDGRYVAGPKACIVIEAEHVI